MTELVVLGAVSGLLAIVAQTGAMFYWGGKISAVVNQHEKRLEKLEEGLDFRSRAR